jgi:hypothetical protein
MCEGTKHVAIPAIGVIRNTSIIALKPYHACRTVAQRVSELLKLLQPSNRIYG